MNVAYSTNLISDISDFEDKSLTNSLTNEFSINQKRTRSDQQVEYKDNVNIANNVHFESSNVQRYNDEDDEDDHDQNDDQSEESKQENEMELIDNNKSSADNDSDSSSGSNGACLIENRYNSSSAKHKQTSSSFISDTNLNPTQMINTNNNIHNVFKQFTTQANGFYPNQATTNYSQDFINMMAMQPDKLSRTCSNASSASFTSSSSSSCSSSYSSSYNSCYDMINEPSSFSHDNHMKALMSAKLNSLGKSEHLSSREDEQTSAAQLTNSALIASFADKFSHLIRSRSNSISESSSTSSIPPSSTATPTTTTTSANNNNNNSEIIKQLNNASNVVGLASANQLTSSPVTNKRSNVSLVQNLTQSKNEEQMSKSKMAANVNGETTNAQCKVCGDEASGYHYGVDSCEGCKGFFRRCITQGMNHQCTNNQQCEMTPFSRNSCQFCRLKKCFAVGMSREASRLGRRPKRAKDESNSSDHYQINNTTSTTTTPIKQPISLNEDNNKNLLKMPNKFSPNKENTSVSKLALNEINDEKLKLKKEKSFENFAPFKLDTNVSSNSTQNKQIQSATATINQQSGPQNKQPFLKTVQEVEETCTISSLATGAKFIKQQLNEFDSEEASAQIQGNTNLFSQSCENMMITNESTNSAAQMQKESSQQRMHQIEMLTKLISYSDKHTSIERTNELEYIRTCIIDSHLRNWPTTLDKIRKRYLDKPPSRFTCESNQSKIDNIAATNLVPMITDVVRFCKNIPGFNQIQQLDQIQLLKQGSFEVIIVNSLMLVDSQNKMMLSFDMDYLMDQNSLKKVPLGFFLNEIFDLASQVNTLQLTDQEIALIDALLIMNPDRGDLQDKDLVEELQSTILHVLYKHLKYFRSDGTELFLKLLNIIPQIQEINRKHSDTINALNLSN